MPPRLGAALLFSAVAAVPVKTPTQPVVDTLFGVKVADPYRWLENAAAPDVQAWTDQQNALMRKTLDAVPGRKAIEDRLWQLHEMGSVGSPTPRLPARRHTAKADVQAAATQEHYFYTRRTGKQNQAVLYVRNGVSGVDRALVDVNALAQDGTRALDWWFPSEDGALLAYGVSADGGEESVLRVRDVATAKDLPDEIPRTRACSLAWRPDGKGFYYTRYPASGTVPAGEDKYHRAVYFHLLGSDYAKDPKLFGDGRDLKDWANVELSPDGRYLGIEVSQGWARTEVFLLDTQKKGALPAPVVTGRNAVFNLAEVLDDRIYIVSNEGAPRYSVWQVDPKRPERPHWKQIIAQSADTLEAVSAVGGRLAALYLKDASSRVRLFRADGHLERELTLPGLGTAGGLTGRYEGNELFYSFTSYLMPTTVFRYDLTTATTSVWQQLASPLDAAAFEVEQVRYPSKDGTQIPMFLVHRKGLVRDGNNPTLLYGYGGFNISLTPGFAASVGPFIERGGVYAVANLRGGAEYGESWHQAGMLGKKQNVFDDFIAAAEYLVATKVTSPDKLACSGRSNGGLLSGAVLTQRPDLFRAAIVGVPLLDMIRYHKFRIAQLWIPEYGSSDDAEQFKWLYAYSPYHHVKDGTVYPATLIFTAESDTRVDPMHARKMTARLQAATAGDPVARPILLRLERNAGHGAGKPLAKVIAQYTDELSFLFGQLGMKGP